MYVCMCMLSTCTNVCMYVYVFVCLWPRTSALDPACSRKVCGIEKIFRLIYIAPARAFVVRTRAQISTGVPSHIHIYINLSAINTRDMPHRGPRFNFFTLRMCRSLSLSFLSYFFRSLPLFRTIYENDDSYVKLH